MTICYVTVDFGVAVLRAARSLLSIMSMVVVLLPSPPPPPLLLLQSFVDDMTMLLPPLPLLLLLLHSFIIKPLPAALYLRISRHDT